MTQRKIGSGGIGDNIEFAGNYIQLPAGTTAERPVSPENGQMRFNTTLGKLEQYNTNGWQAIDTPPIVSTLSYSGGLLAADPAGGETITVTGSNFTSSVTVTIDGTLAPTVSVVDANTVTFTTPAKTAGDYDVTVTNNTGLGATLTGGISYNGTPSFSTAAGKVGNDLAPGSAIQTITIVAAEPDGGALAYSVTSGALPSGLSLASDGDITGTTPSPATTTTYNFTVTATDDENQTNSRAFNLVVLRPVYAYSIPQSLIFNDDDSQYLTWTPASAGNQQRWTYSGWIKAPREGSTNFFIFGGDAGSAAVNVYFNSDNSMAISIDMGSSYAVNNTNARFRDQSAWYHIVIAFDLTNANDDLLVQLWVNGSKIPNDSSGWYLDGWNALHSAGSWTTVRNLSPNFNAAGKPIYLSGNAVQANLFDGYMTEIHFVDGQALTPTSFGETYNGVWVPKDYTGSYGTNGFHLPMTNDTSVEAFNTVTWIGTGTQIDINGFGFKPDLIWGKKRTGGADNHVLVDSVRGNTSEIYTNTYDGWATNSNGVSAFTDDGFSLVGSGSGSGVWNGNVGHTYVAWGWKAGDSNVTNTDGTITSTVRANQTYGFSIIKWTGNQTAGETIGHGLGAEPDFVLIKVNYGAIEWSGYLGTSLGFGGTHYFDINSINEPRASISQFNNTNATSSVITLGSGSRTNRSGAEHIAYAWKSTAGYSKFGTYTGTGSAGLSVTGLGFKPSLLLIKNTSTTTNWIMHDTTRDVTNPITNPLYSNLNNTEETNTTVTRIDFDSDGFTIQNTSSWPESNASGNNYIYAAFADTRDSAFWRDESGNNNDWQPVNTGAYRITTDSPTE